MAGAKGRRFSLPSSTIHMHQPLIGGQGLQGQASDLDIHAREIMRIKVVLNELIAKHTGQPLERVERDTDRDYFLSPAGGCRLRPDRRDHPADAGAGSRRHEVSPAARRQTQPITSTPTTAGNGAGVTAAIAAPTDSSSQSCHAASPQIASATATRTRSVGSACGATRTPPATSTAAAGLNSCAAAPGQRQDRAQRHQRQDRHRVALEAAWQSRAEVGEVDLAAAPGGTGPLRAGSHWKHPARVEQGGRRRHRTSAGDRPPGQHAPPPGGNQRRARRQRRAAA